ncbi:MAG: 4-hydroxy-tetrahydrodipicolinate reductase [Bacteroidetes bacterium]|nr:4-hydroxy-tetrahydrodipicolinate reductase [Bacteroidota bacterium]MCL5027254.1 4-hydroxy-tetrahydrodipicolinate reductase [Chloroflexota bacterium]
MPVRLIIAGAGGRMGREIAQAALGDKDVQIVGGFDVPGHPALGQDIGALAGRSPIGVTVGDSLEAIVGRGDIVMEFSVPEATMEHLGTVASAGKRHVIGTTGLSLAQLEKVAEIARSTPVLLSPNMSLGVNLLFKILPTVCQALGDGYDIEVTETHHRFKQDAPSGTAVKLAEVIANALGRDLSKEAVYGRQGICPRTPTEIGMHALRAGGSAGEHHILFANEGEEITISHRALSRQTFALGAIRAAKWLAGKGPGLYNVLDVLGI